MKAQTPTDNKEGRAVFIHVSGTRGLYIDSFLLSGRPHIPRGAPPPPQGKPKENRQENLSRLETERVGGRGRKKERERVTSRIADYMRERRKWKSEARRDRASLWGAARVVFIVEPESFSNTPGCDLASAPRRAFSILNNIPGSRAWGFGWKKTRERKTCGK